MQHKNQHLDDEQLLTSRWSRGPDVPLQPNLPHQRLQVHAERIPDSVAMIYEGGQFTYAELNAKANQLGHHLQSKGIGPDVVVGLCMARCPELVIGTLGVHKAGGACLFLTVDTPRERLIRMIETAEPKVLLTTKDYLDKLPALQIPIICLDEWQTLPACEPDHPPVNQAEPYHLSTIFFTSGSTGDPKAVMSPFGWYATPEEEADHPVEHHLLKTDSGTTFTRTEIVNPLVNGHVLFIAPEGMEKDLKRLVEYINTHKITQLIATPTLLLALLEIEELKSCDSLKLVLCAGERIGTELKRRFQACLDANLQIVYGCTEVPAATSYTMKRGSEPDFPTVGRPMATKEVYILDEHMQPVPPGVSGEVYLGGQMARGYLNDPILTAEKFMPHPFNDSKESRLFRSGDRGRWLPDGYLEILGRMDDQVKIRGFRIELGEVEAALALHPVLKSCAVVARDDAFGGKRLVAYYVPETDETPSINDLIDYLQDRLPEHMIPSSFMELEAMPLTASGKTDRRALPEPDNRRPVLKEAYVPPRTPLEKDLARIWSEVFEIAQIGIHDNFYDCGGHSLLAVRVSSRVQNLTGRPLPLSLLVQAPTIAQLAALLSQEEIAPVSALVPIQPQGSRPPFFCVHGHLGNVLNFVDLARQMGEDQPFYSLQSIGLVKDQVPLTQIETMAARYIDEIQTVQPQGPYFLGGYCFGSLVALEMAHQLREQNHEVAFLAMFDVSPPLYADLVPNAALHRYRTYAEAYRFKRYIEQMKEKSLFDRIEYLLTGFVRKTLILAHSMLWRLFQRHDHALSKLFHNVESTNVLAIRQYRPRIYHGDMVLFQSQEITEAVNPEDPVRDWQGLTAGGMEVRSVRDGGVPNTGAMFKEPFVQDLAQQLAVCLHQAEPMENSVEEKR